MANRCFIVERREMIPQLKSSEPGDLVLNANLGLHLIICCSESSVGLLRTNRILDFYFIQMVRCERNIVTRLFQRLRINMSSSNSTSTSTSSSGITVVEDEDDVNTWSFQECDSATSDLVGTYRDIFVFIFYDDVQHDFDEWDE